MKEVNFNQLKETFGLGANYFDGHETGEGLNSLPEYQKEKINKSIEQANAGLGTTATEVVQRAREKYGLNKP